MVVLSVHSLIHNGLASFLLCFFASIPPKDCYPVPYSGGTMPDGLMVSSSILNQPMSLSSGHSAGSSVNYGNKYLMPHSSQMFGWNTMPMYDWSHANIGRSFLSPEQYYSTAMMAREFMFPSEWNNAYNPFMSSAYMSPFNEFYSSSMAPFMAPTSSWFSSFFSQPNWQSFNQHSPQYSQFMNNQAYSSMGNSQFNHNYQQQQQQNHQPPPPSQTPYQPPYQPPIPPQFSPPPQHYKPPQPYQPPPPSPLPQHYQPPTYSQQIQQQYQQPQYAPNPMPEYQPQNYQQYSPAQNAHNSWDAGRSLPQTHSAQPMTGPPPVSQPMPTYHSMGTPKIEIGQKLSNSIYANQGSLRYDLSSFSNHEKNNLIINNPHKFSPPQGNPFNPTLGSHSPSQFKMDPSQQALLSDPSFYNRVSQLMPYLNGRFENELSQEHAKQTPSKSSANSGSPSDDSSSEKGSNENKPITNNTKNEYGFFKRLDSQRSGTTTSTTTSTTTTPPRIQRFMSF